MPKQKKICFFKENHQRQNGENQLPNSYCSVHAATPMRFTMSIAAKDNSITPSNLDAAITMRFATSRGQHASLYAHDNTTRQQSCSHYTAICNQRVNKRIESSTHEQPPAAEHRRGQKRNRFALESIAAAPAAHTRYLSSPAEATLHGKTHGFVPRLSPQHKAHATFMQPLRCDLQRRVNKRKESSTHEQPLVAEHRGGTDYELKRSKPHPSHTHTHTRYLSSPAEAFTRKNMEKRKVSCSGFPPKTSPHATFMQPLHGDLQPESQQTHRIKHTWTTTRCRTQKRSEEEPIRARIDRSRTRRTHEVPFIAGWSHFTRKNARFGDPAFPLTQDPVNLHDLHSHSTLHWV